MKLAAVSSLRSVSWVWLSRRKGMRRSSIIFSSYGSLRNPATYPPMRTLTMSGMTMDTSPLASAMMTTMAIVIRVYPPSMLPAPTSANAPGWRGRDVERVGRDEAEEEAEAGAHEEVGDEGAEGDGQAGGDGREDEVHEEESHKANLAEDWRPRQEHTRGREAIPRAPPPDFTLLSLHLSPSSSCGAVSIHQLARRPPDDTGARGGGREAGARERVIKRACRARVPENLSSRCRRCAAMSLPPPRLDVPCVAYCQESQAWYHGIIANVQEEIIEIREVDANEIKVVKRPLDNRGASSGTHDRCFLLLSRAECCASPWDC